MVVGAYWYWSPFLAMHQLRTAAREGDTDSFNDRVNYPRLRESLKGQFSAMMAEKLDGATSVAAILRVRVPHWEPCSEWPS